MTVMHLLFIVYVVIYATFAFTILFSKSEKLSKFAFIACMFLAFAWIAFAGLWLVLRSI